VISLGDLGYTKSHNLTHVHSLCLSCSCFLIFVASVSLSLSPSRSLSRALFLTHFSSFFPSCSLSLLLSIFLARMYARYFRRPTTISPSFFSVGFSLSVFLFRSLALSELLARSRSLSFPFSLSLSFSLVYTPTLPDVLHRAIHPFGLSLSLSLFLVPSLSFSPSHSSPPSCSRQAFWQPIECPGQLGTRS